MQIVIEISNTLKNIADNEDEKTFSHIIWQALLMDAIKNGQPLPAGHGRLIDADVLVDGMEDDYEFCEAVNATPTIIEADGGAE